MRVLIAPDKFAGTLSAHEASRAIGAGWSSVRPGDQLDYCALADGGEGTLDVLAESVAGARRSEHRIRNQRPAGEDVIAEILTLPDGTVVIEAAKACGISALTPDERLPSQLTSRGVGDLILATPEDAVVVVCLGGTSTVDGGIGMLQALGHRVLDRDGMSVPPGSDGLAQVSSVERRPGPPLRTIIAAADVSSPLVGPTGAAPMFGPQKGLLPDQIVEVDRQLSAFAAFAGASQIDQATPRGGAAGGMGFALAAYEDARLASGSATVADLLALADRLADADAVITGEGKVDASSTQGKGPWHLADIAQEAGKPVGVVAGRVEIELKGRFDAVEELGPDGMIRAFELAKDAGARLAANAASWAER